MADVLLNLRLSKRPSCPTYTIVAHLDVESAQIRRQIRRQFTFCHGDKAKKVNCRRIRIPDLADMYWQDFYFWNKGADVRPMVDAVASGLEACGWEVPPDPGREAFAQQPCDPRRLGANRSRRLLRLVSRQAVTRRRRRQGRQQHL